MKSSRRESRFAPALRAGLPPLLLLLLLPGLAACASVSPPADSPEPADVGTSAAASDTASAAAAAADPAPTQPAQPGGTSCADAIPVDEIHTGPGVDAEYAWIEEHYPGSQVTEQALVRCKDRGMADALYVRTAEGHQVRVIFDVGGFFGNP